MAEPLSVIAIHPDGQISYPNLQELEKLKDQLKASDLEALHYRNVFLFMLRHVGTINPTATEIYRYMARPFLVLPDHVDHQVFGTAYILEMRGSMADPQVAWNLIQEEMKAKKEKKAPSEVESYLAALKKSNEAVHVKFVGGLFSVELLVNDAKKYGEIQA